MSTASRDCGMACGACGGDRNAVFTPGSSGKTRGYYDPRAERQLGGPVPGIYIPGLPDKAGGPRAPKPPECGFQPKCEPEFQIAAPDAWALTPFFEISGLRGARLRQSPPLLFPRPPPGGHACKRVD